MITTTVTVARKSVPFIIKAAKICIHLLPVATAAEPYVKKAIHKKQNEKASCKNSRSCSR